MELGLSAGLGFLPVISIPAAQPLVDSSTRGSTKNSALGSLFLMFSVGSNNAGENSPLSFFTFVKYTGYLLGIICLFIGLGSQMGLFDLPGGPLFDSRATSGAFPQQNGQAMANANQSVNWVENRVDVKTPENGPQRTTANTIYVQHEHVRSPDYLGIANLVCNRCIVILMVISLVSGKPPSV
jgi:hypothetical protein